MRGGFLSALPPSALTLGDCVRRGRLRWGQGGAALACARFRRGRWQGRPCGVQGGTQGWSDLAAAKKHTLKPTFFLADCLSRAITCAAYRCH